MYKKKSYFIFVQSPSDKHQNLKYKLHVPFLRITITSWICNIFIAYCLLGVRFCLLRSIRLCELCLLGLKQSYNRNSRKIEIGVIGFSVGS